MKNMMMFLMLTMAMAMVAAATGGVPASSSSSPSSSTAMDVGYAAFFPRSQRSAMNQIKSRFSSEHDDNGDNNFAMTYPFLTQQSRKKNELIHQYRGGGVDGVDGGSSSDAADVVVSSNNKAE